MFNNKYLTYWIIILPIITILITSILFSYKFIRYENQAFKREFQKISDKYIEEIKQTTKNRIKRVENIIETNIKFAKEEEKRNLVNIVNIGHKTIEETYKQYKNHPKEKIIKEIKNRLKQLRFYNNQSGYFFIIDLNNNVLMNPSNITHENQNKKYLHDINGKYFIQEFTNIAKKQKEGFIKWYWPRFNSKKIEEKLGFIKVFEPLNLYIGTARYVEDINDKIKKNILEIIESIKYGKDEYIFVMDTKGTTLSHINRTLINKPLESFSKMEQDIIKNIIKKSTKKEGDFFFYAPSSYNISSTLSNKISYVKKIPSYNWIIGTGQYTTKIDKNIEYKKEELKKELKETINTIIFISVILTVFLITIMTFISKKIRKKLLEYENTLNIQNKELNFLNENLEKKVKEETLKNIEKDQLLNHQAKLASMGEMIGNIAHQWRQPLSAISTAASGIKIHDEMDMLNKELLHESLDAIINNTKLLSNTIDDFREFFRKDKKRVKFNIVHAIRKVLKLLYASLKNKNIQVIENIEDIELYSLENEFIQAILNIINNAKEALLTADIEDKYIFIDVTSNEEYLYLKIKDNANGIDEKIIDKIFEPYFTTKFKSQGTGIGLYMSRTIIVNHMNGQLNVSNKEFIYENKKYKGAQFEIILKK
ncbi:cache domain-containing protein [Malaciobacter mytili]|uniref:sensor histidine kinase n=1 Tax=Malaciobacter mytili TaxID=603050 RepID=UPI003BAFC859